MWTLYPGFKLATVTAPRFPSAPLRLWTLVWLSVFSTVVSGQVNTENVTITPLSDQLVYTPLLCDPEDLKRNPQACAGAWISNSIPESLFPVVTTTGQDEASGDIIPQVFFRFRASTLQLNFVPWFNGTANLTLSNDDVSFTQTIRSSLGTTTVVNIPQEMITTMTITVLPSLTPIIFGLLSIILTVPVDAESTSIFPSQTLPDPTPISTFFTQTTTSYATSTITMPATAVDEPAPSRRKSFVGLAVGLTVGLGLGLTLIGGLGFFYWKHRRKTGSKASSHPPSILPL